MRKFIIVILAFVSFGSFTALGQAVQKSAASEKLLEVAPQEEVYLHYNSGLLFPGEYLLYKVYTLSAEGSSKGFSDLSKVAYVELVGEDGNVVFSQKVKLEKGTGQADFFVPTTVASGNYKLVSYTNWMKNRSGNFFEADITIINPYQSGQKRLLEPLQENKKIEGQAPDMIQARKSDFLDLSRQVFGNREKVVLKIKAPDGKALTGNYSLSVRKLDDLTKNNNNDSDDFMTSVNRKPGAVKDSLYLPELRGHLFEGTVVAKKDSAKKMEGIKVALSLPQENMLPIVAGTNGQGEFFFNLDKEIRSGEAVLEILGAEKEDYELQLKNHQTIAASQLDFESFYLSPEMEEAILERSVYNQIENAFFSVKPDSLRAAVSKEPGYKQLVQTYKLDDYKRFKTVPETFVEIINSAWIRKDSEGKAEFRVRGIENNLHLGLDPLVLVDGVLIQEHDDLAYMNAGKIDKISIIREKLYLGPQIFQGAVLVETIDGDFNQDYQKSYAKKLELKLAEVEKTYFKQQYVDGNENSHIPDFRYQLLWLPDLEIEEEAKIIQFFTSDVTGAFEVVLQGFNEKGEPISERTTFKVGADRTE